MEAVRVRDWLAELRSAGRAEDIDRFQEIVGEMAKVRPDFEGEACRIAGEYFDGGEIWTADLYSMEVREKAEDAYFGRPAKVGWRAELDQIHDWEKWVARGFGIVDERKATVDEVAEETEEVWKDGGGKDFRERAEAFF